MKWLGSSLAVVSLYWDLFGNVYSGFDIFIGAAKSNFIFTSNINGRDFYSQFSYHMSLRNIWVQK